ncbi:hypothetical protein ACWGOQ_0022650 [Aquimarina sp. M1]
MKKRHEQKLIILSLVLLLLFNIPLILIFNYSGSVYGFPVMFFSIFLIWAIGVLIAAIILMKYYE